jgi:bacterioferritin
MQGDALVIQHLNLVLRNELTAINQYFLHARMLRHWGVTRLGRHEYGASLDEMKDADALIERILFLDGLPNLQDLDKLLIGEDVEEILGCDLTLERRGIADLRMAIAHAETVQDYISRDLMREILKGEEEQVDFIETALEQIKLMGLPNYIQAQSAGSESG